ncbi:hypothetical protein [Kribbella speibonae]|uniref:Uncharacterized protein n=1 Tax=Kribbella speibonae TaxID=1572660 RepID=A0A4R0ILJ3_9ACTN|nr:hypothetical protein [Kribbella speibonae]TCC33190.1 hypothetical protein E0H92_34150 [Kribbella speibonae]
MQMLASLLPGLRDVRTPLAVGFLWFFTIWLFFGDRLLHQLPAGSPVRTNLLDLSNFFGTGAVLTALSFAAYLFGAVVTVDTDSPPIRFAEAWIARRRSKGVALELMDHLEKELAKYGDYPGFGELVPADDLQARLLVVSQGMYDQYDRLEAEATFRINIAIPMVAFAVVLSATTPDPDWRTKLATVVVVALAALIFAQGIQKHRLSHGVLMRAVLAGLIEHPSIVRARLMAEEYPRTGEEEQAHWADMRSFMRHELGELSRAHSMKAAADEQDDPAAARLWRNEIHTIETRFLAMFDPESHPKADQRPDPDPIAE